MKRSRNASSTSYDFCSTLGPTAAAIRSRLAPRRSIASIVASLTPPKSAAPTGVRRSDDSGLFVGEEHRRTVGGEHSEQDAGTVGDHGIGMGPVSFLPRLLYGHNAWRVHLVDCRQAGPRKNGVDRAAAVLCDQLRVIAAAVTDIEPPHLVLRDAADTPEETMRQACQDPGTDDFDGHRLARMMMSSSACSPTMNL
jgi:hypothetical protein